MRVHVVDDDASFRTAMERRLTQAGYEVATYPSAQNLLDRLPSESVPGCILLDVRIPGLSGPELQERLSKLGSTLPIIFITGYPDFPTTVRTIKAGAEDFLTKPVSADELLPAIERAIARHETMLAQKNKLDLFRSRIKTLTPREKRRVRDRAETWSQSRRRFRAGYLHDRQRGPCRSQGCAGLWMHRVSNKAILSAGADGAAQESCRASRQWCVLTQK